MSCQHVELAKWDKQDLRCTACGADEMRCLRDCLEATKRELETAREAIAAAYRDASGELAAEKNANESLRVELERTQTLLQELIAEVYGVTEGVTEHTTAEAIERVAETRERLQSAETALDCITRCNSNEFSEEPDVIAKAYFARYGARSGKPEGGHG